MEFSTSKIKEEGVLCVGGEASRGAGHRTFPVTKPDVTFDGRKENYGERRREKR